MVVRCSVVRGEGGAGRAFVQEAGDIRAEKRETGRAGGRFGHQVGVPVAEAIHLRRGAGGGKSPKKADRGSELAHRIGDRAVKQGLIKLKPFMGTAGRALE